MSVAGSIQLASGAGNGDGAGRSIRGGIYQALVYGAHGGGTTSIQVSGDGVAWIDLGSFVADGAAVYEIGDGAEVRASISGGTGNSITATLRPVR